jgi:hypothetical protein
MISVSQIYDTVLALTRKDKRGLSLPPSEYNNIITAVNQRVWRITYHNFETNKLSMDELGSLKVIDLPIVLDANGVGSLPTNYFHLAGDPWYNHTTEGRRRIDLITSLEHGQREMDYYTKASLLYPTAYVGYSSVSGDMALYITPKTCTPIYISYLRQTLNPYLDYYVNSITMEITYMPETTSNVSVPYGCVAPAVYVDDVLVRAEQNGPVSIKSYTQDFEWHPHDEPQILAQILQSVGIALPDELLIQVGSTNEVKVEKE